MASITIRKIDERLKAQLRVRAAERGRSMEEEARRILREALERERPRSLTELAREIFGPEHGIELEPHPPVKAPAPPKFSRG